MMDERTSIEEMFASEERARKVPLVERAATLAAARKVLSSIALDQELRAAVQQLARFWMAGDVDTLLNDEQIDETARARCQGRKRGFEVLLDEISNPEAVEATILWLADNQGDDKE